MSVLGLKESVKHWNLKSTFVFIFPTILTISKVHHFVSPGTEYQGPSLSRGKSGILYRRSSIEVSVSSPPLFLTESRLDYWF